MSKVDLTQGGLINWNDPADVARFDAIAEEIARGSSHDLVEQTIALLGSLGPGAPDDRRAMLSLAALHLRTAWRELDARWTDGSLSDFGEALGRRRPLNWRQDAHAKHHEKGPLIFAEMSFDISAGKTRAEAAELASRNHGVAKRQVDAWYDSCRRALLDLADAPADRLVDEPVILAFGAVARERGIDERTVFDEIRRAVERSRKKLSKHLR
jgi:hypothetical protein